MNETHKIPTPGPDNFEDLSPWQQRTQTAIWALLFLVGELALTLRVVRDKLHTRGVLLSEDEDLINQACISHEKLTQVYGHMDQAFQEKCNRVFYALSHPQEVPQAMQKQDPAQDLPKTEEITFDDVKTTAAEEQTGDGPEARIRFVPNADVKDVA
jgi:hypothetical protein